MAKKRRLRLQVSTLAPAARGVLRPGALRMPKKRTCIPHGADIGSRGRKTQSDGRASAMTLRRRVIKKSKADLLARIKMVKKEAKSCFCDVCGWDVKENGLSCAMCPKSFHVLCLGEEPPRGEADDFVCHTCSTTQQAVGMRVEVYWGGNQRWFPGTVQAYDGVRRMHRVLYDDGEVHDEDFDNLIVGRCLKFVDTEEQTTTVSVYEPPPTAMLCFSCGYFEMEAICCQNCRRWMCFACACLSASTLPECAWRCPGCVGLIKYDKGRQELIAMSRQRVARGEATAAEINEFSQLVFDQLCSCVWDEWQPNLDALVELTRLQLTCGEVPAILPFHSLHYRVGHLMRRQIAEAYAEDTKNVAYKLARLPHKGKAPRGNDDGFRAWRLKKLLFAQRPYEDRLRIGAHLSVPSAPSILTCASLSLTHSLILSCRLLECRFRRSSHARSPPQRAAAARPQPL